MDPGLIYMFIFCFVLIIMAFFMPKKLKRYEFYATSLFAITYGLVVDMILAVKYKFYTLLAPGVQWGPLFGQLILYSTASMIVLNYYPYHQTRLRKIRYVISVTLVTLAAEMGSAMTGFIRYHEWKFMYSALSYPFLIMILVWNLEFFRWLVKQRK